MKNYLALARVSSDDQEYGFSLDIQEDALRAWAVKNDGNISKMYRVIETAHKSEKRVTFHEMLDHARRNPGTVHGLLFYKIDRAARNMKDWVALTEIRDKYGIDVICITEPFNETPAGKLNSNMLAAFSQFHSDQLSVVTQKGVERRVQCGFFSGRAPYGYQNYRENGRGYVRVHPERAANVRRIFTLYAFHSHSLDTLVKALRDEGRTYTDKLPAFARSKLYSILTDRSYIGEVRFHEAWRPGNHEALIDVPTFERVQILLGRKTYHHHESTYGNGLITCGHCGRPVVCETKHKGGREYHYYRCAAYNKGGHPRSRVTEVTLDIQILALFDTLKIEDRNVLQWLQRVIRAKTKATAQGNTAEYREISKQLDQINRDRDSLLTLRMHGEINADTYAIKDGELLGLAKSLRVRLEGQELQKTEIGDTAMRVLELSQRLESKWVTAENAEKRVILEIVCLNLTMNGATLDISMRKPFDAIVKGLKLNIGRGGRI